MHTARTAHGLNTAVTGNEELLENGEGEDLLLPASDALDQADLRRLADLQAKFRNVHAEITKAIKGQDELIWLLLAVVLAGGHMLLVSVPGLAKTLTARALTKALGFLAKSFVRIQFTVDTRPTDILGYPYPEEGTNRIKFQPGGIVWANVVLADEINRTPPATQACLLEAMAEHQVTNTNGPEQETIQLQSPFFVIATQNPIEHEGTFPLPEAQLDRFMISTPLSYPSELHEQAIIADDDLASSEALDRVNPTFSGSGELRELQRLMRRGVKVPAEIDNYVVRLVATTRPGQPGFLGTLPIPVPRRPGETSDPEPMPLQAVLRLGGSPRASMSVRALARAFALIDPAGKGAKRVVSYQHVKDAFVPCLWHRLLLTHEAVAEGITPESVLSCILAAVPLDKSTPLPVVPRSKWRDALARVFTLGGLIGGRRAA